MITIFKKSLWPKLRKGTAVFVCAAFISTSVYLPKARAESPTMPIAGYRSLADDLTAIALPKEIGKIQETYRGTSDKIVVLIQDAHSIPDAQRSIRSAIDHFQTQYGVSLVGLEGASEKLDPQIFRSFPDKELLRKTFDAYSQRGELTGGTAAALFNTSASTYHGIEDWPLYEEGVSYFLKATAIESEIKALLEPMVAALNKEKETVYSKELLEIDRLLANFGENKTDLAQVLNQLSKYQPPPKGSELAVLLEEIQRDQITDTPIEIEIKKIAEQVASALKSQPLSTEIRQELLEFNGKLQEFRTARTTPQAFALYLKGLVQKHKIRVKVSRKLAYLVENQKRLKDIEGTRLFEEFKRYADSVKGSLFQNDQQKTLDIQTRGLELIKRLTRLELSFEDWGKVQKMISQLDRWTVSQDGVVSRDEVSALLRKMEPHLAFYRVAEKRDQVFLKNIQSMMGKQDKTSSLLVAGGFHTEGLTQTFKAKGISYVLVMPSIGSIPEEPLYREHMQGQVSWSSYFEVKDGKVNLYDAFVRAIRDKLLGDKTGSAIGGKEWRDQIIRDLAADGRITQVSEYTRFIDETTQTSSPDNQSLREKWLANIDHFGEGLKKLQTEGNLSESSILQLIKTITTAELVSMPLANRSVNVELLPSIQRSERPTRSETRALPERTPSAPTLSEAENQVARMFKRQIESIKTAIEDKTQKKVALLFSIQSALRQNDFSLTLQNELKQIISNLCVDLGLPEALRNQDLSAQDADKHPVKFSISYEREMNTRIKILLEVGSADQPSYRSIIFSYDLDTSRLILKFTNNVANTLLADAIEQVLLNSKMLTPESRERLQKIRAFLLGIENRVFHVSGVDHSQIKDGDDWIIFPGVANAFGEGVYASEQPILRYLGGEGLGLALEDIIIFEFDLDNKADRKTTTEGESISINVHTNARAVRFKNIRLREITRAELERMGAIGISNAFLSGKKIFIASAERVDLIEGYKDLSEYQRFQAENQMIRAFGEMKKTEDFSSYDNLMAQIKELGIENAPRFSKLIDEINSRRQEARVTPQAQKPLRSEARKSSEELLNGVQAVHVNIPFGDSSIDLIFDNRMVYQLNRLNLAPEEFAKSVVEEIQNEPLLAPLKEKLRQSQRGEHLIDAIQILSSYKPTDDLVAAFPRDIAIMIMKREVFNWIAHKKTAMEKLFGRSSVEIDYRAYYRNKLTLDSLYQALKGQLLSQITVFNEIGDRIRNARAVEDRLPEFQAWVKANEDQFSIDSKILAYEIIFYTRQILNENDVDHALEAEITRLKGLNEKIDNVSKPITDISVTREQRMHALREVLSIDPNRRSLREWLENDEKILLEEEQLKEAIRGAKDRATQMKSVSTSDLLQATRDALLSNDKHYATALLNLVALRDGLAADEYNTALTLLPLATDSYDEAGKIQGLLIMKYRQALLSEILVSHNLTEQEKESVSKVYLEFFSSGRQERENRIRQGDLLKNVASKFEAIESSFEQRKNEMHAKAVKLNSEVYSQKQGLALEILAPQSLEASLRQNAASSAEAQLQIAKSYFEVVYGVSLEIPYEEDTDLIAKPTSFGSNRPATLYSKNEMPKLLERLKQLDQWLAALPAEVVLRSLSFQKILIVKEMRAFFSHSENLRDNKIALALESDTAEITLYHELGHSLHGPRGSFAAYISPERLSSIILQHAEALKGTKYESLIEQAQNRNITEETRSKITWDVFQMIFDRQLQRWLEFNKKIGVTDLNAPFKPERTSEKFQDEYGHDGISPTRQKNQPSLTIEYMFEQPFEDNFGGQLTRDVPVELIAEYTQLFVTYPDALKKNDPMAYDMLQAIMGDTHSQASAVVPGEKVTIAPKPRAEARSEQRVVSQPTAEVLATVLKPGVGGASSLNPAELREVEALVAQGKLEELTDLLRKTAKVLMDKAEVSVNVSATTVKVTKDMAEIMVKNILTALEASGIKGNLTIGFDVSPDRNFMEALQAVKDGIGTAVFTKDKSRKLDRKALEGVTIQTVGSLKSYKPLAAENAGAVPVLSQNLESDYFSNEALFGVGLDAGKIQGEPFLEVAENVVRIAAGLLKADLMTKGLKPEEINAKLLGILFKLNVGSSHGVLSMSGRHLVVHREALQQIMLEYQAAAEVRKAA